jgi:hypothetical protein
MYTINLQGMVKKSFLTRSVMLEKEREKLSVLKKE